jgi:hypothetical protein
LAHSKKSGPRMIVLMALSSEGKDFTLCKRLT